MTIVLTVVAGVLMVSFDMTVMSVAIPRLASETGASLPVIQWTSTGYTLALAAVIPTVAWTISRFGAREVFLVALALFMLASALVAASWDVGSLLTFRILQGVGGGLVMPAGMTITLQAGPFEQRGRLMALMGLPVLVGPVLGPVLGGWLLDAGSWRWVFLANLPLGLLGLLLGRRNLPRLPVGPARPLDVRGLLLLPPGLALLVLGTSSVEAGVLTPRALVPLVVGLLLGAAFVRHAFRSSAPLLDVRLLARRLTGGGTVVLLLFSGGWGISMILIPLYWQVVRGESATVAGLYLAPVGLAAGVTIQVAGRLIDRWPPLAVIGSGIAVATLAHLALVLRLSADAPAWQLVTIWVVGAVGAAATIMPTTTVATRALEGSDIASGSTLVAVVSTASGALGVAAVSVLLASELAARVPQVGDGGVGALDGLPPAELARLAPQLAEAFRTAYGLALALLALAGVVALLVLRRPPHPPVAGRHAAAAGIEGGDGQAGSGPGAVPPVQRDEEPMTSRGQSGQ